MSTCGALDFVIGVEAASIDGELRLTPRAPR